MKYDRDGNVRCRVCGCTEIEACNPPCSWVNQEDLCSTCYVAAFALAEWRDRAHRPAMAALLREAKQMAEDPRGIPAALSSIRKVKRTAK